MDENQIKGFDRLQKSFVDEFARIFVWIANQHKEELGQTILNSLLDEPGPKYISRIPSAKEKYFRKLFDGCMELHSSYHALLDIETYINRFPFRDTLVTKPRYLRYHIENYFNEMYLLKERLLAFLTAVGRSYRKDKRHSVVLSATRPLFKSVSGSLENVINTRGRHVHQKRYSDAQIERLELMELFSKATEEDSAEFATVLQPFYQSEYRRIRSEWKTTIKRNNVNVKKLLDLYGDSLFVILFSPNSGEFIYPDHLASL